MAEHLASSTEDQIEKKNDQPARREISFAEAFRFWVKLGFISFGGPAGQIAIMHRELVERRRWIGEARFMHALNYCMLLPGPEAQQLAIYIGWLMHRIRGGVVAGVFFVVPSIFLLLALSYIYAAYGNIPAVAGALYGFKPVVVAIVVEAVLKIGRRALKRNLHFLIAASAFVAIYFLHIPFPIILIIAAVVGMAGAKFLPDPLASSHFKPNQAGDSNASVEQSSEQLPLVIADDAVLPLHTRPSKGRTLRMLLVWLMLWAIPFVIIIVWRGWDSLHAQEYRFFTYTAFITFGGAYTVLAYVIQAAVLSYGWMTHAQAVDGLALAETTPGPLIMVLQFIGFLAAWNNPQGIEQTLSAVTGALITTYTTFLPCFFFIFIGAPYIEILRGNRSLAAALSGVTAAIVGVMLNLALVFGATVIWPSGIGSGTDWFALSMSLLSFIALYRFKADVLWIVLTGGLVGLMRAFFLNHFS